MSTTIDELLVGLGFDYDPKELKSFKDDIGKTVDIVQKLTVAVVAGATAVTALVISSAKASDAQGKLAEEVGLTVSEVDALQFANERAGGSVDGMSNSLQQLSIRAGEASRGVGSGIEAFGILGISATDFNGRVKDTNDLLLEVSTRFQGLDESRQIELADKLGIKDSIRLLQQGPAAIRALINESKLLGETTAEDAAIGRDLQDSLTSLWKIAMQLARVFTRTLGPIITGVTEGFIEWWKANRAIVEQNIPQWIERFTRVFKLLGLAVAVFIAARLGSHLFALIGILRSVTVATLAMNSAALLIPILIGAAVVAFAALVEDARVFFEGGESVFGDLVDEFSEWEPVIVAVAAAFFAVNKAIDLAIDGISMLIQLVKSFSLEGLSDVISNIPGFITHLVDSSGAGGLISNAVGGVSNALGFSNENTIPSLPSTNSQSSTSIGEVSITVQESSDAKATAREVKNELLQQASQDLNNTVDQ